MNVRETHFADARIHGAVYPSRLSGASKPATTAPMPCIQQRVSAHGTVRPWVSGDDGMG